MITSKQTIKHSYIKDPILLVHQQLIQILLTKARPSRYLVWTFLAWTIFPVWADPKRPGFAWKPLAPVVGSSLYLCTSAACLFISHCSQHGRSAVNNVYSPAGSQETSIETEHLSSIYWQRHFERCLIKMARRKRKVKIEAWTLQLLHTWHSSQIPGLVFDHVHSPHLANASTEMTTTLPHKIRSAFDKALASGHLIWTNSTLHRVPAAGIEFQVRLAPSLGKKPGGFPASNSNGINDPKTPTSKERPNPFLPFDPAMFVDALEHHNLLLNKFSIVAGHVLLCTKGSWRMKVVVK